MVSRMLELLSLPLLLLLPGCWPVFAYRRSSLSFAARCALAIVLSPLAGALQLYLLRAAGIPLESAARLVVLINLPAAVLIWRALRGYQPDRSRLFPAAAVLLLVAGCISLPWLLEPEFRRFSWHGLMHADVIYSIARSRLLPEEPELAGLAIEYPWVGDVYWLLLAAASDLAPTVVYVPTNLVLAGAIGVLYARLARELGASETGVLAAPVVLALGIAWTGLIGWSLIPQNASGFWWGLLGDPRTSPFAQKLAAFGVMYFGLGAFVALALFAVLAVRRTLGRELLFIPLLLAAIAAIYPLLLPSGGDQAALVLALRNAHARASRAVAVAALLAWRFADQCLFLVLFSLGHAVAMPSPPLAFREGHGRWPGAAPSRWRAGRSGGARPMTAGATRSSSLRSRPPPRWPATCCCACRPRRSTSSSTRPGSFW
jgi:hypothetical protein